MKIFTLALSLLFCLGLNAQSKLVSFEELTMQKNDQGTPVYSLDGRPYTGKTYDYYQSENVKLEHHLHNGLLTLKEGFRDDQKIEYAEFKEGQLDGIYLKYFGNGQKYVEHHYRNGKMHGDQYGWKKDGSLRFVLKYDNGLETMRVNYPPPGGFDSMIKH